MTRVRGASTGESANDRPHRRTPRLGVVLLLLSGLFFGVNFVQEWLAGQQMQQQVALLRHKVAYQHAYNAQLRTAITYYRSKSAIIDAARANGMSMPGDTIIQVKRLPARVVTVYRYVPAPSPDNPFVSLLRAIFK